MVTKAYEINSKKVISETLDGETIIINLENGNYFSVNEAGSAVWDAISKHQSFILDDKNLTDFIKLLEKEELILETKEASEASLADQKNFTDPKIEKYEDMQEMLLADPVHDVDPMGWPKLKEKK